MLWVVLAGWLRRFDGNSPMAMGIKLSGSCKERSDEIIRMSFGFALYPDLLSSLVRAIFKYIEFHTFLFLDDGRRE